MIGIGIPNHARVAGDAGGAMTAGAVRPNRRGVRSREIVLDAAERVMADDGFEAATVARLVEEAGVPPSSLYHYFGSKDGVLLAVMERGAQRFFADLPIPDARVGTAVEHLRLVISTAVGALERHPDFLRLLIVFAVQPPSAGGGEVADVVSGVRTEALARLQTQIAIAFGDHPDHALTERLARFTLAAFDGAFLASRADPHVTLGAVLEPLPDAIVEARRAARKALMH
jgi:AcrR family transcriptional regulator